MSPDGIAFIGLGTIAGTIAANPATAGLKVTGRDPAPEALSWRSADQLSRVSNPAIRRARSVRLETWICSLSVCSPLP